MSDPSAGFVSDAAAKKMSSSRAIAAWCLQVRFAKRSRRACFRRAVMYCRPDLVSSALPSGESAPLCRGDWQGRLQGVAALNQQVDGRKGEDRNPAQEDAPDDNERPR